MLVYAPGGSSRYSTALQQLQHCGTNETAVQHSWVCSVWPACGTMTDAHARSATAADSLAATNHLAQHNQQLCWSLMEIELCGDCVLPGRPNSTTFFPLSSSSTETVFGSLAPSSRTRNWASVGTRSPTLMREDCLKSNTPLLYRSTCCSVTSGCG